MKPSLREKIDQNLRKMAFPESSQSLFAFSYKINMKGLSKDVDGWRVFNIFEEFLRQVELKKKKKQFRLFNNRIYLTLASGFYKMESVRCQL